MTKIFNYDRHPHSFDLGPVRPDAPHYRARFHIPAATLDNETKRIVSAEVEVDDELWAKVKAMPQFQALCRDRVAKDGATIRNSARMGFEEAKPAEAKASK